MTWDGDACADAIAQLLGAIDGGVKAFAVPPETFNPPAYVVRYPQIVNRGVAGMGIDRAELPVSATAGPYDPRTVRRLLGAAIDALEADPTFGGVVLASKVSVSEQSWRIMTVAGAEVLACDLLLEIRM